MSDKPKTYHGDTVRTLFLTAAFIMTATLPVFAVRIDESIQYSVTGIIVLCIAAGMSSPKQKVSGFFNTLISLAAVVVFEMYAVMLYTQQRHADFFFITNQVLALIFVAALYFSIKTIRRLSDGNQE